MVELLDTVGVIIRDEKNLKVCLKYEGYSNKLLDSIIKIVKDCVVIFLDRGTLQQEMGIFRQYVMIPIFFFGTAI